ncbi:hypothetical protein CHS0354_031373 [Potamilus streckersoni]|uniref:Uncharacterized protein n=1 Tax=Potamilus streckersoni TaxID=2493646 RepID=A0AAE0SKA4_9BIVA|nr:hypothetical protein CHS0354_031373 [Potamilus streckersoni]
MELTVGKKFVIRQDTFDVTNSLSVKRGSIERPIIGDNSDKNKSSSKLLSSKGGKPKGENVNSVKIKSNREIANSDKGKKDRVDNKDAENNTPTPSIKKVSADKSDNSDNNDSSDKRKVDIKSKLLANLNERKISTSKKTESKEEQNHHSKEEESKGNLFGKGQKETDQTDNHRVISDKKKPTENLSHNSVVIQTKTQDSVKKQNSTEAKTKAEPVVKPSTKQKTLPVKEKEVNKLVSDTQADSSSKSKRNHSKSPPKEKEKVKAETILGLVSTKIDSSGNKNNSDKSKIDHERYEVVDIPDDVTETESKKSDSKRANSSDYRQRVSKVDASLKISPLTQNSNKKREKEANNQSFGNKQPVANERTEYKNQDLRDKNFAIGLETDQSIKAAALNSDKKQKSYIFPANSEKVATSYNTQAHAENTKQEKYTHDLTPKSKPESDSTQISAARRGLSPERHSDQDKSITNEPKPVETPRLSHSWETDGILVPPRIGLSETKYKNPSNTSKVTPSNDLVTSVSSINTAPLATYHQYTANRKETGTESPDLRLPSELTNLSDLQGKNLKNTGDLEKDLSLFKQQLEKQSVYQDESLSDTYQKDQIAKTYRAAAYKPSKFEHSKSKQPKTKMSTSDPPMVDAAGEIRFDSLEVLNEERKTFQKAETAYKNRIKQLEEEANGFLKTIENISSENTLLRRKLDEAETSRVLSRVNDIEVAMEGIEIQGPDDEKERTKSPKSDRGKIKDEKEHKQDEDSSKRRPTSSAWQANDELHKEIRDLKAQLIKLQSDNHSANEENMKLKAEHLQTVKRLYALEKEKASLESSVTAVESEKLSKIQGLENEKTSNDDTLKHLRQENEELQKKVDALEFENKTLSASLAQKKLETEELLGAMKDDHTFDNEIKDLKSEVIKLKNEKDAIEQKLQAELINVRKETIESQSKSSSFSSLIDELKNKLDQLEIEKSQLNSERDTLQLARATQLKENETLKEENEKVKRDFEEERTKYEKLKDEANAAKKDLEDTQKELEKFREDHKAMNRDKDERINQLMNELERLKSDHEKEREEFKKGITNLKEENDRLEKFEKHMNAMEARLKNVVEQLETSEKQRHELENQIGESKNETSSIEQQAFQLNLTIDNLKKKIAEFDREKKNWLVQQEKFEEIESSNRRLTEENKHLRMKLELEIHRNLRLNPRGKLKQLPPARPARTEISDPKNNTFSKKNDIADESRISEAAEQKEKDTEGRLKELERWVEEVRETKAQRAVYIGNTSTKDERSSKGEVGTKKVSFSKSKASQKDSSKRTVKSSPLKPSRSMEDLRKNDEPHSARSSPSLPAIDREVRLTFGLGYRAIHMNKIKAATKVKKVF